MVEIHTKSAAFENVTRVRGTFESVTSDLNIAAAGNKQFVVLREEDGSTSAFHVANILKIREPAEDEDAYLGR